MRHLELTRNEKSFGRPRGWGGYVPRGARTAWNRFPEQPDLAGLVVNTIVESFKEIRWSAVGSVVAFDFHYDGSRFEPIPCRTLKQLAYIGLTTTGIVSLECLVRVLLRKHQPIVY